MMQKDEDLLLEAWVRFHAYLFGYENLYVFDNGSELETVKATLSKFEILGLNVDRDHIGPKAFDDKGHIVAHVIREFEQTNLYDIVIPLDCDEFVVLSGPAGYTCGRKLILDHLDSIPSGGKMVRVSHCLDNRPGYIDLFRLANFSKTIVPLGDFRSIDHGFHEGKARSSTEYLPTRIIYIHLHFKPFHYLLRHAKDKLAPFTNVEDPTTLSRFSGVGRHLVRYFEMDEMAYFSDLGNYRYPLVRFSGFASCLSALMDTRDLFTTWCRRPQGVADDGYIGSGRDIVDFDTGFDANAYIRANPDVGTSGMDPATHWTLFGFREGRKLT